MSDTFDHFGDAFYEKKRQEEEECDYFDKQAVHGKRKRKLPPLGRVRALFNMVYPSLKINHMTQISALMLKTDFRIVKSKLNIKISKSELASIKQICRNAIEKHRD